MTRASYEFSGKVALVTGSGSGIGRAAALKWAEAGATLVLADIDEISGWRLSAQIVGAGGRAIFRRTDIASMEECEHLVNTALRAFGRLDAAFNNAGQFVHAQIVDELSAEQWQHLLNVNWSGVFNCMRHEIGAMKAHGGAIVNTSSIMGLIGTRGAAAYCASKHGVIGLTRAAAMDHGQQHIRVNAICPGFVRTPMTAPGTAFTAKSMETVVRRSALRRLGEPEEVAEAALWLCSESAAFVTGSVLTVDGGFTAN